MKPESIRSAVRERYGSIAVEGADCCTSCCGPSEATLSEVIGYTAEDLAGAPAEANLGLGSGNPVAAAELEPGETVLDLGSGGGLDCFIAASKVGPTGQVIGVDMTPEMVERARKTASERGADNVEFRLGEVEALPVADESVDVVISNCVLNLSPERSRALKEAHRVLKPGGRLVISDLISEAALPDHLREEAALVTACQPVHRDDYTAELRAAGFERVTVTGERAYPSEALAATPEVRRILEAKPDLADEVMAFATSVRGAILSGIKPME
ncbi:MAG: arsenite methyltransferase [Gemmatimonadota bacterium]|nr:MAG: arsenite methyltransferase [Gemmatimonadota bacterium]